MSGTQDMIIVKTDTVSLEWSFAEPFEGSFSLLSLNLFETYWKITPDVIVLLDVASWTQIK